MKKRRRLYIVLVVVAVIFVALGLFFVFGDVFLDEVYYDTSPGGVVAPGVTTPDDVSGDEEGGAAGGSGSGGGSGGSGGSGSGEAVDSDCNKQQIQYSLQNFKESFVCKAGQGAGCVDLEASCSMDVYNLDGVDGVFAIEYFFVDSGGNEMGSVLIEKNVDSDKFETFSADFAITGAEADENANCPFAMRTIPLKCVD